MNFIPILMVTILVVYLLCRLMAYAVLEWNLLPKGLLSNGSRRVHHFVYGNILIFAVAVTAMVTDWETQWQFAVVFGIGLGLVIDEFPHWIGDIKELSRNVTFIRSSFLALVIVELALLGSYVIGSL